MANHTQTGKWGEDIAIEHLVTQGYAIVDRNFRIGHKEIDIIAIGDGHIVFVEVKTRTRLTPDSIAVAMNPRKVSNLCIVAEAYVRARHVTLPVRFDLIIIEGSNRQNLNLTHQKGSIRPRLRAI